MQKVYFLLPDNGSAVFGKNISDFGITFEILRSKRLFLTIYLNKPETE